MTVEKEYSTRKFLCGISFALVSGPIGTWAGLFFGSLGSDNIRWWSFCFLATACSYLGIVLNLPKAIRRTSEGFQIITLCGPGKFIPLTGVQSVGLEPSCCGPRLRVNFTAELFAMAKLHAGPCAFCVHPYTNFCLDDYTEFTIDHGLAPSVLASAKEVPESRL